MFRFALAFTLLTFASAEFCYNDVKNACSPQPATSDATILANCNAKYGSLDALKTDLQTYANAHIESSFEFLLLSTHFGNYEANREGFKKLYRKYSDKAWEDAIDMMKFITRRGGRTNFNQLPRFKKNGKVLELNELNSLARALDTQKQLAEEALRIHTQTQHHSSLDASVGHYMEEQFMESQAKCVRELAGYTNDLKNLLSGERDASLSVFLFDEYLKKVV